MNDLRLSLRPLAPPNPDGFAELEMAVGNTSLTALLRPGADGSAGSVRIPAAALGFWLADHWWRLRWEAKPALPDIGWRMAHDMAAIGHGHAWPPVTIWGDRDRVLFVSSADRIDMPGPVRFLSNAVTFVRAAAYEQAMDGLLDAATNAAPSADQDALRALIAALRDERDNPENATWRRIEAICGYDPDMAPDGLINGILAQQKRHQPDDVEEAVAATPGPQAAVTLSATIEQAQAGIVVDFADAVRAARKDSAGSDHLLPWMAAEQAATALRLRLGRRTQPLLNRQLAELCAISTGDMGPHRRLSIPYALRLAARRGAETVLLNARWAHDRRFQIARALGDAVWSNRSTLGPITSVGTARQKFQRAFAAALLCPAEGLVAYLGTEFPGDADIAAAARHFHVNERTVRTVLVNKQIIQRHRVNRPFLDPEDSAGVDQMADAA